MEVLHDAFLLGAKGQASPQEMAVGLFILGVIVIVCLIYNASATINVKTVNGVPFCPQCNRQVTYRRNHCRSCGYSFRAFGRSAAKGVSVANQPALQAAPSPVSSWERLHRTPSDLSVRFALLAGINASLNRNLLGPKKIETRLGQDMVVMTRARLQYEAHISLSHDDGRHGFEIKVPTHGFHIRITCPRHVPDNVVGAPWDDLLANLCKIDRSIIASRKSKSQPLMFAPETGTHPLLRVEVLSRRGSAGPPALPRHP